MTIHLFSPGDRVRCSSEKCPVFKGKVGTVEGYDDLVRPAPVLVRFDFWSNSPAHFAERDLVKIEPAACRGCVIRGDLGCDATCPHWPHDLRQE